MSRFGFDGSVATVRDVQTDAASFLTFTSSDDVGHVVEQMDERKIDFVPVIDGEEVVGRVSREALAESRGVIGDVMEPLSARFMISADSPIRDLLRWLAADPWLLVIDGNQISGVVTPSDLNRQGPRAFFYVLVAAFEIRLADSIRRQLPGRKALELLSPRAQEAIEERRRQQADRDFESDCIALMTLTDLLRVSGRDQAVLGEFQVSTKNQWDKLTGSIVDLRNDVMHPTRPMITDRKGILQLIKIEERLFSLLEAATANRDPSVRSIDSLV